MYLQNIQLTNFKNYENADFNFSENVNAIVGDNGTGKTNLLDAIHYLSFCKSYFSSQDQQSVRFNADFLPFTGNLWAWMMNVAARLAASTSLAAEK